MAPLEPVDPGFYLNMASFDLDLEPFQSFTFDTCNAEDYSSEEIVEKRIIEAVEMASPGYLEVEVNEEQKFVVHEAPLLEHCELLVQLTEEAADSRCHSSPSGYSKMIQLQITKMPGGCEAFEMAARFCYNDADFNIHSANVAMLRCAGDFLKMTEALSKGNLTRRTEEYIRSMVLWSWEESLSVLRSCKDFYRAAEKAQIIQRCAISLVDKASRTITSEIQHSGPLFSATGAPVAPYPVFLPKDSRFNKSHRPSNAAAESWWFDDIATLSVHLMEPVIRLMITNRSSDHKVLAKFLLHYLRSALPVLGYSASSLSPMKLQQPESDGETNMELNLDERLQQEVVEVVVRLLADLDSKSISCRSLLGLRRIAVALRAGKHCRRELERMIGRQLDKATLDNILIPALPPRSSSLYDVDLVLRLVDFFLQDKAEALLPASQFTRSRSTASFSARTDSRLSSLSRTSSRMLRPGAISRDISMPVQSALTKVGELMDKYLAEIAADSHLKPSKFLALAESLPDYARRSDDGLYRAVDIYLEAHPHVSETDATRLFKVLNYHKLGGETCKAASENPRFPPSFAIQVALVQQSQLKATNEGSLHGDIPLSCPSPRIGQQTVVHLQCSSFEFTLRQRQQKKKSPKISARGDSGTACRRSRADKVGIQKLMRLFNPTSRQK